MVACKEATSCRCCLEPDPPATSINQGWRTGTTGHRPRVTPLSPIPTSNRYQPLDCINNPDPLEYEVEKIVATRTTPSGVKQYYVKWSGSAPHHNTWEDEADLTNAQDVIGKFLSIVPDPSPLLTQCQVKLCPKAAGSEFPKCRSRPRSTRCAKHSCVPCGPATHCPCQTRNKRHCSPSPPPNHPVRQSPNRPPTRQHIPRSDEPPSPPDTVSEHNQLDTQVHAPLPPSPPPPNEPQSPDHPAQSTSKRRSKRILLESDQSPPPPAKHPRPEPLNRPKRTQPDSGFTRPPPTKKPHTQNSTSPTLGRKKKGSKRVAKPGPRKKKTPHI